MSFVSAKCKNCGANLQLQVDNTQNTAFCPYCGTPYATASAAQFSQGNFTHLPANPSNVYRNNPSTPPMTPPNYYNNNMNYMNNSLKSKIVALLLCIFVGGFGIHRFYVGKIGTGLIWLFTGGCFGIGWLIDIILIATDTFKDKDGLPLRRDV